MAKIYVASSWRNTHQPAVVQLLRAAGHQVYDFRHPAPGNEGFAWSSIDPDWQAWNPERFRQALGHPVATQGYGFDVGGMEWADQCVLVLPAGRSAHLEAGWFAGQGRPVTVLALEPIEPELMYLLAGSPETIVTSHAELLERVRVQGSGTTIQEQARELHRIAERDLTPQQWDQVLCAKARIAQVVGQNGEAGQVALSLCAADFAAE